MEQAEAKYTMDRGGIYDDGGGSTTIRMDYTPRSCERLHGKQDGMICVLGGNVLLGNRFKNRYGRRYNYCPHCEAVCGKRVTLRESHVLFNCPAVACQRRSLGLSAFKAKVVS